MDCHYQPDGDRYVCIRCGDRRARPVRRNCGAVQRSAPVTTDELPCIHRGREPVGQQECKLCGQVRLVDLYRCELLNSTCTLTTLGRPSASPPLCLTCDHRQEFVPGRLRLLRPPEQIRGVGLHLAGWPHAVSSLAALSDPAGVLFDDFVDQTFSSGSRHVAHREPWVGVFHHPPPGHPLLAHVDAAALLARRDLQDSLPSLRLALATSEHLAGYLRTRLDCDVATIRYPGARLDAPTWSREAFLQDPGVWQLGWFARHTRAIHALPPLPWPRRRVMPARGWVRGFDERVGEFFRQPLTADVEERPLLSPAEYRSTLAAGVVFCEVLGASANTVVCECLAQATPLVINRHPAVAEYLGDAYPLFYETGDYAQAAELLADVASLTAGHDYLRRLDLGWLSPAAFRDSITHHLQELV